MDRCLRHPCSSPQSIATGLRRHGRTHDLHPRFCDTRSARIHYRTADGRDALPENVCSHRLHAVQLTTLSKGRVERAIRYVRDSFWAARGFTTLEECNRQALRWGDDVAHQRPWPDDRNRTVAEAFIDEQPRLLPLPLNPF